MSDEPAGVDEQGVISQQTAKETQADEDQRRAADEFSRSKGTAQRSMVVKVYSPFRDYYDGQALSVSAENATGSFDILPGHHNFISLLIPCNLVIRAAGENGQKIRISGGVMHVKADKVIVFLDI
jgi:F-type H+-transporting ATPase subunit epsilon